MSTLTNYEGLLALSTSPHLSQAMRDYLVSVLAEHREMRAALTALREAKGHTAWTQAYDTAGAVLAKVEA